MKKILTITFSILFHFNYSQTIEVKYYENMIIKNLNQLNNLPQSIKFNYSQNFFSFTLTNSKNVSYYEMDSVKLDSIDNEQLTKNQIINENGDTINFIETNVKFDISLKQKKIFKDFSNNKIFCELHKGNLVQIEDTLVDWKWIILEDTDKILGYKCKKAISTHQNSKYTAWFTEEIAINDGPQRYSGLPGLILKLTTNSTEIIAYKIGINEDNKVINKPTFYGKMYTFNELSNEIKKLNNQNNTNQSETKSKIDFSNIKSGDKIIIKTD